MKILSTLTALGLILALSAPSQAQIIDKKVSGKTGVTPPITESELGSEMNIDNSFNMKSIQEAFDKSSVKDNIKTYMFSSEEIYKVRSRVNMATLIVLPDWEIIEAFTIGDAKTYEVNFIDPDEYPNMVKIQGLVAGVDTNFQIVGLSGRIYNFYVRTDPINSKQVPDYTVFVQGMEPKNFRQRKLEAEGYNRIHAPPPLPVVDLEDYRMARADYLKTLPAGEHINAGYVMSSPNGADGLEIAPHGVFDDGKWTFFDFRGALPSDRAPIVMKVIDGYDSQVNSRWQDGMLVAETVSTEGWTLKNGHQVVCVRRKK